MPEIRQILFFLAAFLIVAVAANQISRLFLRIRLPLITGLLVIGIIAGPEILGLISPEAVANLDFINDIALAFIAFAVGSELYLAEMRSRFKSIAWMTVSQMVVTFLLSSLGVYFLSGMIPFMQGMDTDDRIAVSILTGTIFIARSPASAIAVVNELRARGPFTQTALGVTVVIDFLVVILFALTFAIAESFIKGISLNLIFACRIIIELALAFILGYILGKLLGIVLSFRSFIWIKTLLILLLGWGAFRFSYILRELTDTHFFTEIYIEPLLICILGSFIVTNYSSHRPEFLKLIKETGQPVYVVFFTLIGSTISVDLLEKTWLIALLLFGLRLCSLIITSFAGGALAREPLKYNMISWMPYLTQAGVSIGLTAIIAAEFLGWGNDFATLVLAVIVLNQLVGPPLFKWAITHAGESHVRADGTFQELERTAVLFGIENQSFTLARQLLNHGWKVKIAALREEHYDEYITSGLDMVWIDGINPEAMQKLEADKAVAIVAMLSDEENFRICELAFEKFGTRDLVVRLNQRHNFGRFHRLGAKIVEPSTAIVSLLDHFVRSPQATSLLLGMQEDQDTIEVEVQNPDIAGLALRDLRLPHDIIILSVTRSDHMIISHGYTRLRMGDILTLVGSSESLDIVQVKFAK
jgi:Trk K+ transport system NAD-binding subunit/Kef-type K+ transport system membrane component KefB